MKLAPAIEEFIQYKRALGNLYIGPANVLKAFLRKTGNLELDALTSGHCEAFLPAKGGEVTNFWFKKYQALDCLFRFSTSRGYMKHRILPTSMPDRPPRFIPYIYSTEDIRRLLGVPDSHYPRTCPLSPDTMRTLSRALRDRTEIGRGESSDACRRQSQKYNPSDSGNEVRKVATSSDRKGSCQHPQTLPNAPSSGCGYQRPPTLLATKIGMMIRNDHADHQFEWLRKEAGYCDLTAPAINRGA